MKNLGVAERFDYDTDSIVGALRAVGLKHGDLVFSHIGLGFLGIPRGGASIENASRSVWDAFWEVLGDEGTWLIPTYSYSFTRNELYDPAITPSDVGEFTEYFRQMPDIQRSLDPMFSVAGKGPQAAEILNDLPHESFGRDSVYDRLVNQGARLCNLGVGFRYATFIHHVEQMTRVPYRFPKLFKGEVLVNGEERSETWLYNVRILADPSFPDLRRAEAIARDSGLCAAQPLGRSEATLITARDMWNLCIGGVEEDPWFMAAGPSSNVVAVERERVLPEVSLVSELLPENLRAAMESVVLLPRDVVSDGAAEAVRRLGGIAPLKTLRYPTGTVAGGYTVPERWSYKTATVLDLAGDIVASSDGQDVLPFSYSRPIDEVVPRETLLEHLHVAESGPDVLPYAETPYRSTWELRSTRRLRDCLSEPEYSVIIDADFSYGEAAVGEWSLGTGDGPLTLVCGWLGHRDAIDDGLSGVLSGISAFQSMVDDPPSKLDLRLLVVPGPSALAAYIDAECPGGVDQLLFLDRLAGDDQLSLRVKSSDGDKTQAISAAFRSVVPDGQIAETDRPVSIDDPPRMSPRPMATTQASLIRGDYPDGDVCPTWRRTDWPSLRSNPESVDRAERQILEAGRILEALLRNLETESGQ
jgi:aminoglycoside N3'-acetyltransferase